MTVTESAVQGNSWDWGSLKLQESCAIIGMLGNFRHFKVVYDRDCWWVGLLVAR